MKIFQGEELPQPKSMLLVSIFCHCCFSNPTLDCLVYTLCLMITLSFFLFSRRQLKLITLPLWQVQRTPTQSGWNW